MNNNSKMPGDRRSGECHGRWWPHASSSSCFQHDKAAWKSVALLCVRSNSKWVSVVLLRRTRHAHLSPFHAEALHQVLLVMFEMCTHLRHLLELKTHGQGEIPIGHLHFLPHLGCHFVKHVYLTFGCLSYLSCY